MYKLPNENACFESERENPATMDIEPASNPALEQPTRARLFRLLCSIGETASTDELASRMGRHPNGIRLHLQRLQEAGLVTLDRQVRGRGRPRDVWSVDPSAKPDRPNPTAYADLSIWLAGVIGDGPVGLEGIESRGRAIGAEIARTDTGESEPRTRFREALGAMGFQPEPVDDGEGHVTYCLGNCPYRDVARESLKVVCGLHRGITEGFLAEVDPGADLTDFQPKNPDEAGCLVGVSFAAPEGEG